MHKIISVALFLSFFIVPLSAMNTRDRVASNQKDPRSERNKQAMPYNKRLETIKKKARDKENYLKRKQERNKKESINFDR